MPTCIRLRRGGRTHSPYYRIVVIDSRHRDRGPEIETLGVHHPCARPEPISEINAHRALDWLTDGAQPTDTVKSIFKKMGVMKHFAEGTRPDVETATIKGGVVEAKGYNAPPPPKEPEPEPEPEAEAPAEGEAEASAEAEAPAEEAPTEEAAAEEAPADEEKAGS